MDLQQKLEYQQSVETYLEDNQVYDLFEYLLKEILVDKPEEPIDYLISKLEKPRRRRLFVVGSSGKKRNDACSQLAARFSVDHINLTNLLKDEVSKGGKWASAIKSSWKEGTFIDDEAVLEILMPVLEEAETKGTSYLLEGAPRTRVQALAFQRAGLVPDRLVILKPDEEQYKLSFMDTYSERVEEKPQTQTAFQKIAQKALEEYHYHVKGLKEVYGAQWHEVDSSGDFESTADNAAKVFLMKGRSNAPRSPPKIIILGPPGSGRTYQAQKIATKYGLEFVSTSQLLRDTVNRKTEVGQNIASLLRAGDRVPDFVINDLVQKRLNQTNCKMNGWVLDGFPKTTDQARALKEFKINPTHVFILECPDSLVYERCEQRRIDPLTGKYYNLSSLPEDPKVTERLAKMPEDDTEVVKKRLLQYKENATKLHTDYAKLATTIKADQDDSIITELIGDTIENSISHEYE